MITYTITEKSNRNSQRKGYDVFVDNLAAAQVEAENNQMFLDTVLCIERGGELAAYKEANEPWVILDL